MTEVNDFCTTALHDPSHDVYGRIMTIKKGGCCENSNFIFSLVGGGSLNHLVVF
jgi:hypothetical protein